MAGEQGQVYSASDLTDAVTAIFAGTGVSAADARLGAAVLVRTNLRGIDTHGVSRVLVYAEKIKSGEVNPTATLTSEYRDGVLRCDGHGGLGQVVATASVREAVRLAGETPVVTCIIRESGHLASLGLFVLEAAERGFIAFLCQETPPLMALAGSHRPAIGNNPIAFAAPLAGRAPLVFDMATSVVARGNVLQAARNNRPIPEGWAIGPDGNPTTSAAEALKGAMLPIAGHKGVGLAMLVQCLAGSLSGSLTAESAANYSAMSSAGNVSAFLMVINPDRFIGRAAFDAHMNAWLAAYADASGPASRYPGQRAAECEAERAAAGIPLPAAVVDDLRKAAALTGAPFNLAPLPSKTR